MFVKIMRKYKGEWNHTTYYCHTACFFPILEGENLFNKDKPQVMIRIFNEEIDCKDYIIERQSDTKVFYLNNDGKTIDRVI